MSPWPSIERVPVDSDARVPGGRTNAYLVGDDDAVLVDPAVRTDELDEAVRAREVAHIALTHTHPDHVGAVVDYAAELDATVWARAGRADHFRGVTGVSPDATFREGTTVGPATVLDTPGHASDHVAFVVGDEAVSGDVAFASGSVVIAHDGDLRAYLTTLRRLLAHGFDRLHPGHGAVVEDPDATLRRLLRHRLSRDGDVLAAVEAGARTADDVVDAVYDPDIGDARPFARLTVEAHLRKLAVEGDVAWDGERVEPA